VNDLPSVTIIIPTRPGQAEIAALTAARQLDYPRDRLQIIVARGRQPAVQRNSALRAADGELIYFLDDDSRPAKDNLRRAISHFQNPAVTMVGGPNLCPPEAPLLEQVFSVLLSSWLAFGPSRARYDNIGAMRESGEKELILCNLMARKKEVLDLGGFDESLYPNEENALMDDLQKRGAKLIYDPEFMVHRRPRPTLKAFVKMLFTYGRGRAEQFRLHPTPGSALNLVPPLFCAYLLLLPIFTSILPPPFDWLIEAPVAAYFLAALIQTIASMRRGFVKSMLALPLLVLTHICYGIGFWRGLFTKVTRGQMSMPTEVVLEQISL
jgi:cellulose synthase/poly-beta-1,6-N-acetylglucosamine synthase-like glycosyltransferase